YTTFAYAVLFPKTYSLSQEYITNFLFYSNSIQKILLLQIGSTQELLYNIKYKTNDILIFADFFYSYFSYNLILIGVLLLTAMLGSIILTFSTKHISVR